MDLSLLCCYYYRLLHYIHTDGSFPVRIFPNRWQFFGTYHRCDGLREKPKALRSVTQPRSRMPIMSTSRVSLHELTLYVTAALIYF